jgi:aryl-alcohol dehydrogenase-like predicted oxidoreductase
LLLRQPFALHCLPMFPGRATAEGTARYQARFPQLAEAGHFRRAEPVPEVGKLYLSSIGLGTYLGEPDDSADREYTDAIASAVRSGINVLDTAINYRHQRSERNLGTAIKQAIDAGVLQRNEVLVCTKAGYLSFDGNLPPDPRAYFTREYIEPGILDPAQVAGGMHCMTPEYLANQIERSRHNLGLETIDVFYIHNPETQLGDVSREVFQQRLRDAFAMLEKQVKSGKIVSYGLATWSAFRLPDGARDSINLWEVVKLAREAGGEHHHFRFVQLPFNLAMPEAYGLQNQRTGNRKTSLLTAAQECGIAVIGSATLYQGQLTHGVPESVGQVLGLKSDAENAIQFSRSAPGIASSLVGMGHKEHVVANLKVALVPPTASEEWSGLFRTA